MAFSANAIWEVRQNGDDANNGGGFDYGNCTFASDLTCDANTGNTASPVVSSASYAFVSGDVGARLYVASGTNWTPGWYPIASVSGGKATLNAAIGSAVLKTLTPNIAAGCATVATPTGGSWTIDYSVQDAAQITYDGTTNKIAIDGTTNTKATATPAFGVNLIGNIISITAGTGFTVQRVQALSISSGAITFDKALGTAGSTGGTGRLGGGLASSGKAAGLKVGSNVTFVKAGTFTLSTSSTNVSGGPVSDAVVSTISLPSWWVGYNTTRTLTNLDSTRPIISAGSITGISIFTLSATGIRFRQFVLDGNSGGSTIGLTTAASYQMVDHVKVQNATSYGFKSSASAIASLNFCEATGCSGTAAIWSSGAAVSVTDCEAYNNSTHGFYVDTMGHLARCLSYGNTGSGKGFYFSAAGICISCTAYGNASDGFLADLSSGRFEMCIAEGNAGYGWKTSSNRNSTQLLKCAGYNNTAGNYSAANMPDVLGFIAGTAGSFFVDALNGNFALNNLTNQGAMLRGAGFPATFPRGLTANYSDIGAAQHRDGIFAAVFPGASYVHSDAGAYGPTGSEYAPALSALASWVLIAAVVDTAFVVTGHANYIGGGGGLYPTSETSYAAGYDAGVSAGAYSQSLADKAAICTVGLDHIDGGTIILGLEGTGLNANTLTQAIADMKADVLAMIDPMASKIATVFVAPVKAFSPMISAERIQLVQYGDYHLAMGRELHWDNPSGSWHRGDLTGCAVQFAITDGQGRQIVRKTGAVVTATGRQRVICELDSADTAVLTSEGAVYSFEVAVASAGNFEPIVLGTVINHTGTLTPSAA